ncbi:hypothetical protein [Conexibacter woesei]|uniref:Uncharacterized protein n=1 Tax=Conexibacter woesei (strain DSM 14684 / CCUG 47730 / CIP 108061 / JCM 11494 / NBRC 100937 / ID131577) TaxID=469383 RepID=D3FBQ8_CONWI|nr:hypothetical protein [Conexibacter woesei]ADB51323.1 hypothetical protein Cwoe_2904 [Conexibacter woesei DSM 14684]
MSTDEPQGQPSEEEMRAALQEELKKVRVEQVVMEATVSILNVSVMRAGLVPGSESERDLDQVRVGIEGVRALLPLVELIAGEQARPIRDALSQLQMAYVQAAEAAGGVPGGPAGDAPGGPGGPGAGPAGPGPGTPQGPPQSAPPQPGPGDRGPAQRSGRLWVPGQ